MNQIIGTDKETRFPSMLTKSDPFTILGKTSEFLFNCFLFLVFIANTFLKKISSETYRYFDLPYCLPG
jgi:hypothetical protein